MIKKTITYEDYNGVSRTEDFYFNLTNAEIAEMELSTTGGMAEMIQRIISAKDTPEIVRVFKNLILRSYGVKSADGRRFIKSPEISREFTETEAYSQLFIELASDAEKAAAFVNGVMPVDSNGPKVLPSSVNADSDKA